jgi:hypothetical protein
MCLILIFIPLLSINQEIGAGQFEASVRGWFVENDLGPVGVNDAATYEIHVDVVEPHGPLVGSAHAAETKGITFSLSLRHILEAFGGFPDDFDQRVCSIVLFRRQFLWC